MQIPAIFDTLCKAFYPESREEYTDVDAWIRGTISEFISLQDRPVLRAFLDEILSGRYSNREIEAIYESTGPTWGFGPSGTRLFLEKIRAELG